MRLCIECGIIMEIDKDTLEKFQSIDNLFNFIFLMVGLIQAGLFQIVLWRYPFNDVYIPMIVGYALFFILPLILSLFIWIFSLLVDHISLAIYLRILSISILLFSFTFYLLAFFTIVYFVYIQTYWFNFYELYLIDIVLLAMTLFIIDAIIGKYRMKTYELKIWKNRWFDTSYILGFYFGGGIVILCLSVIGQALLKTIK